MAEKKAAAAAAATESKLTNVHGHTVQRKEFAGISVFATVDAQTATGGVTPTSAIAELKAAGYKTILNMRYALEVGASVEASKAAATAAGLQYLHLTFNGHDPVEADAQKIFDAFNDESNYPMYIHCRRANRVGGLWLIKRVVYDDWAYEKAAEEASNIGYTAEPVIKAFVEGIIAERTVAQEIASP
jgi:uncharacterized protein (TIGR01244 family)